jgi:hypothetical protein
MFQSRVEMDDIFGQFVSLIFYPIFTTVIGCMLGVVKFIGFANVVIYGSFLVLFLVLLWQRTIKNGVSQESDS